MAELNAILDGAKGTNINRCMDLAAYSVLVYDWLLCLPEEVPLIRARISVTKVAYLLCRFWPLIMHPITTWVYSFTHTVDFCDRMFRVPPIIFTVNFALASVVLSIRLYAFTRCNRKVAVTTAATLSGVCIYKLYIIAEKLTHAPMGKCYPIEKNPASSRYRAGYIVAPVLFDCSIVIMFFIYALRTLDYSFSNGRLTRRLLREGFLAFLAITTINLANCAMGYQKRYITYSNVLVPWGVLLPNVVACRLMLSMRRAVENAVNETTAQWSGYDADQSNSTRVVFALIPVQTIGNASQLEDGTVTHDGNEGRRAPFDTRQETEPISSTHTRD
ncbi:hypothetical protein BKA62DRAFT_828309 [Auriculariales sp. MPI-PUGE-AT-0066]|nr:hypothetical protein BKA62DRAFT_828309 [Auriculariales sp. MPI-PUGE-AT-0066]